MVMQTQVFEMQLDLEIIYLVKSLPISLNSINHIAIMKTADKMHIHVFFNGKCKQQVNSLII
jgi:hypothetical protein